MKTGDAQRAISTQHQWKIRKCWEEKPQIHHASRITFSMVRTETIKTNRMSAYNDNDDILTETRNPFVFSPTCRSRLVWDIIGMFLLVYDFVMIPIRLFESPETVFYALTDWATLLYWTFDMVFSTITGFVEKGVTIMEPKPILIHYLKTWFVVDLCVVGPDWVVTLIAMSQQGDGDGRASTTRLLRIFRIFRTIRLLRATKLKRVIRQINDQIESEVVFLAVHVAMLMIAILFFNHLCAGIWYFIGDLHMQDGDYNWIQAGDVADRTLGYRYIASLNWSLSNFGFGQASLQPQNDAEGIFAICLLMLGISSFVTISSQVTTMVQKMEQSKDEAHKQLWLLRRFFRQKAVPRGVAFKTLRYIEHKLARQEEFVQEAQLDVLLLLSDNLKFELTYSVHYRPIRGHPLFDACERSSEGAVYRLSSVAFTMAHNAPGDIIFKYLQPSSVMTFVTSGILTYTAKNVADSVTFIDCEVVANNWLSEQTLWAQGWSHLGDLSSIADVETIKVHAEKYAERVQEEDIALFSLLVDYAVAFVDWLKDESLHSLTDVFNERNAFTTNSFLQVANNKAMEGANDHGHHDHGFHGIGNLAHDISTSFARKGS